MEDLKYSKCDWILEVHNGDTVLGYQEWVAQKVESDMEEIEALNSSCE